MDLRRAEVRCNVDFDVEAAPAPGEEHLTGARVQAIGDDDCRVLLAGWLPRRARLAREHNYLCLDAALDSVEDRGRTKPAKREHLGVGRLRRSATWLGSARTIPATRTPTIRFILMTTPTFLE